MQTYQAEKTNGGQPSSGRQYYRDELELMSTHQLREICRREKIIRGVVNPMDKEELVQVILRYRGADENLLIGEHSDEGRETLDKVFTRVQKNFNHDYQLEGSAKITVYNGLAVDYFDRIILQYDRRFIGTNAVVVSDDREICAIFNVRQLGQSTDRLYLVKTKEIACHEAPVKNYSLYCFDRRYSDMIYRIYTGEQKTMPNHLEVYKIPLLDFTVREPVELNIPLDIDFGTSNTAAGTYLDSLYFEQRGVHPLDSGLYENDVNYTLFYDVSQENRETALLPSVVAVKSLVDGVPEFAFGYEAVQLANASYIDESFCAFYDIKRWIGDYEKAEEITDRHGHYATIARKDIIKAFLEFVIEQSRNRFKCNVREVHISCPVKQKHLFQNLFTEILPEYAASYDDTLDEGVAVLYNTIADQIQAGSFKNGQKRKALILDCGGGTIDLCSCVFTVEDQRVSYRIDIEMTYENGDTNFGGNNLTYRIMQLLKLELAQQIDPYAGIRPVAEILQDFDIDVFRYVDEHGTAAVYQAFEEAYERAERVIPTRFKDYERLSRTDYYKVQNNFYFLFNTAERVKKEFFNRIGTLRICLSHDPVRESGTTNLLVDKWKLSVAQRGGLDVLKNMPPVYVNVYDIELLLRADIYGVVSRFLERMYENDELFDYNTIKLSGQSCKIGIFADAIKEFIPGRVINFKRQSRDITDDFELKMTCVDGALKYLKDKKYGYADIRVSNAIPALPYVITAMTHSGQETTLIHSLDRSLQHGQISRNMENLTLKLNLKDTDGVRRYSYTYHCRPDEFEPVVYADIRQRYGEKIPQDDTDNIIDREVKFFVWSEHEKWGFLVVPVTRRGEDLLLGREQFYSFENDAWVLNFFDGTH